MKAFRTAEDLEARLGDPDDVGCVLSFRRAVERDEADEYPRDACEYLDGCEIQQHYIPSSEGGRLTSFPELAAVFRVVARRDLTVAIAHHKTFLGAVHVWVAGSAEQRAQVAEYVRAGGRMALCYHEKEHGSDLMATETAAVKDSGGGYVLFGEKWLVNNATVGDLHTVFARTDGSGPRAFSLFLVDKRRLAPGSYHHLPRLKTDGARGADFSGIRFENARLPADALIGRSGDGLELSLRSFQVTRTLIPALSLGAADTALRTAIDFALDRKLHGTTVFAMPGPKAAIVNAFLDLLACDCVITATTRALHCAPEEMRLWSAAAKYFVSGTVARMLDSLGEVLGARSFLREGHKFGIFQKVLRDHRVIPIFHGGGFTLLETVSLALPHVISFRAAATESERNAFGDTLDDIFSWRCRLPPFEPKRLAAYARIRDPLLGFERFSDVFRESDASREMDPSVAAELDALVDGFQRTLASDNIQYSSIKAQLVSSVSLGPELARACERYCSLHAAAACLQTWLHNRRELDRSFAAGEWLVLSLRHLLASLAGDWFPPPPAAWVDRIANQLLQWPHDRRSFSLCRNSTPKE